MQQLRPDLVDCSAAVSQAVAVDRDIEDWDVDTDQHIVNYLNQWMLLECGPTLSLLLMPRCKGA